VNDQLEQLADFGLKLLLGHIFPIISNAAAELPSVRSSARVQHRKLLP
jgi:hypothetical protein